MTQGLDDPCQTSVAGGAVEVQDAEDHEVEVEDECLAGDAHEEGIHGVIIGRDLVEAVYGVLA